jgi:hypothetical protein
MSDDMGEGRDRRRLIDRVMREVEAARNRKGMQVGFPQATVDCNLLEWLCNTAEARTKEDWIARFRAMRVCEWEMRDAARRRGEMKLTEAHSDRAQLLTELIEAAKQDWREQWGAAVKENK